jgi:hypothetical protein
VRAASDELARKTASALFGDAADVGTIAVLEVPA